MQNQSSKRLGFLGPGSYPLDLSSDNAVGFPNIYPVDSTSQCLKNWVLAEVSVYWPLHISRIEQQQKHKLLS